MKCHAMYARQALCLKPLENSVPRVGLDGSIPPSDRNVRRGSHGQWRLLVRNLGSVARLPRIRNCKRGTGRRCREVRLGRWMAVQHGKAECDAGERM